MQKGTIREPAALMRDGRELAALMRHDALRLVSEDWRFTRCTRKKRRGVWYEVLTIDAWDEVDGTPASKPGSLR